MAGHSAPSVLGFALVGLAMSLIPAACAQESTVNFRHLRGLTETIAFAGDSVDIVHVYSNYPDYQWFDAADAGVEGTACVDDAARAAVLYLRHYELEGDNRSLGEARRLLKFVLGMQTADGMFYNFVHRDHTINTTGRTSSKSFGWWAARATWALGTGYRVFLAVDPPFAAKLGEALDRCLPHVSALLQRDGEISTTDGYRIPHWLLYESGADATSELLLGLTEYASARNDRAILQMIQRLANGLMVMQDGSATQQPYGLHRSWETMWHMWGNSQTEFLADAGKRFHDSTMISSAKREAEGFYSRLLIDGFEKEFDVTRKDSVVRFEQIAYAVRPMAVGLIRLFEATKNRRYLIMAGLTASWLFGDNAAGVPMYDPTTGRGYDGVRDSTTINRNSGAESTIEALMTILEVQHTDGGSHYFNFKKQRIAHTEEWRSALYVNPNGEEVSVAINTRSGKLVVLENQESRAFQNTLR